MCQFCKRCACVEDETHILFMCEDPRVKALRDWFFGEMLVRYRVNLPTPALPTVPESGLACTATPGGCGADCRGVRP